MGKLQRRIPRSEERRVGTEFRRVLFRSYCPNLKSTSAAHTSSSSGNLQSQPRYWKAQHGQTSTSHPSRWSSPAITPQSWHMREATDKEFRSDWAEIIKRPVASLMVSFQSRLRSKRRISWPNRILRYRFP